MGLDMYAFTTESEIPTVDFDAPEDRSELHYWRKHPDLHGWMKTIYRGKGGSDESFNCVPVRLDKADLDRLERDIKACALPPTQGFFFGQSDGYPQPT